MPSATDSLKTTKFFLWYGGLFLLILLFTRITDFNGLYGQDSYEYVSYTNCLTSYFTNGVNPGNYFWPLFYPLCGSLLSIFFKSVVSLQLISIVSFALSAFYLESIIISLFNSDRASARSYVALFFVLSPYALRSSMVVMSDSLCVALIIAAFYYFLLYNKTSLGKYFVLFICCAVAAVTTRYAAFMVFIIPIIIALHHFSKNFNWKTLLSAAFITITLLLPHFIIAKYNVMGTYHHPWLEGWSTTNFFQNQFNTLDGNASYTAWNIIYSLFNLFHPAFCFWGIIFIVSAQKSSVQNGTSKIMVLCILTYGLFLAGIPFQNLRFLLLSYPLVLIILYPGFNRFFLHIQSDRNRLLIGITIIIQLYLFYSAFKPFYLYNQSEKFITASVLKYSANTALYTFSIDGALRYYGVSNRLINLWKVKVDTIAFAKPAMILFNERQFHKQWKDKNPIVNWEFIKMHHHLIKLESLPDNWELYEIE